MRGWLVGVVLFTGAVGCEDGTSGSGDAGAEPCETDESCDDGIFCNGVEQCTFGADSDGRGCVPGLAPCEAGLCDEVADECGADCSEPDADGDGALSMACGGDDCDDTDPARSPDQTEVCDAAGVDEDCDPATLGGVDEDGDGFVDAACCNGSSCGPDCDDGAAGTNPTVPEVCDDVDNDCDGATDEEVRVEAWPDPDGDGWGDAAETPAMLCAVPTGQVDRGGDCDETSGAINPAADDVCNAVDDDCDGTVDEGAGDLCRAGSATGAVDCVEAVDGSASCRPVGCGEAWDCDGDPANGCEVDLCAGACGRCAPCDAISANSYSGRVTRNLGNTGVEGATVLHGGTCGVTATTDADGSYSMEVDYPPNERLRASTPGYIPTWGGADMPLVRDGRLSTWLTSAGSSPSPDTGFLLISVGAVDGTSGPTVLDVLAGAAEPSLEVSGAAATASAGVADGHLLIPGVLPGRVAIAPAIPSNCSLDCTRALPSEVWVEEGAITYLELGDCSISCID